MSSSGNVCDFGLREGVVRVTRNSERQKCEKSSQVIYSPDILLSVVSTYLHSLLSSIFHILGTKLTLIYFFKNIQNCLITKCFLITSGSESKNAQVGLTGDM